MDYIFAIIGYLLGSIPFGLLVSKHMAKIGDLREQGSGNIGATNMLRVGGKKWGAFVLCLDAMKGVVAVLIAPEHMQLLAGLMAVLGHVFPIWLKGKGGKGVATSLGVLTILYYPVGALITLTWLLIFAITRISSMAAIAAMLASPALAFVWVYEAPAGYPMLALIISVIVLLKHRANIGRIRRKEEPKTV